MFEFLVILTALVLVAGTIAAYVKTHDVLHSLLFLGPLFFYSAVLEPWRVSGDLSSFFPYPEDANRVLVLNLLAVSALILGCLHDVSINRGAVSAVPRPGLQERERVMLQRAAVLLAAWALAVYWYSIANVGGFVAAFSQVKGGGSAASGYLSEGMNLSLAAIAMVALSRYRRGWTPPTVAILVIALVPNLVQGTFGGRRGPLFLALTAALVAQLVVQRRTPKLWVVWSALAIALLSVAFIGSQRRNLYLGSEEGVSWEGFRSALTEGDASQGNNFIYGTGFVLATEQAGRYTWGRELATNLLVRPVPRQLWPTKYEDVGATWVTSAYPGLGHLTQGDWLVSVGWLPLAGSSAMSVSDLFGEFGWGAVFAFYLIGRAFTALRRRRLTLGGMWTLLYVEALILSIYLATQSFSAFYYRYLILAIPTVIAWRVFVQRRSRRSNVAWRARQRVVLRRPVTALRSSV